MELRFLSFCYSAFLCKQHQDCSCTGTGVCCGILSHLPHSSHLRLATCIQLHDNNFRPVVWLWKPFHRHFVRFRRKWDPKASIINTFTTFLLLSFSKILFVSFTLLHTFDVRSIPRSSECFLYYDATVECSTQEYSIFVSVAICVLVIFILFPTVLLIVYPTRLFRMCASCCGFQRWHVLHMFAESFQGQYKDGTNGTRDCRMVSSTFLILRILILASFSPHNWSSWPIHLMYGVRFL